MSHPREMRKTENSTLLSSTRWGLAFSLVVSIIASLLLPLSSAQALSVKWVPAGWGYTYAASNTGKTLTKPAVLNEKAVEAKSTFIVNYTGITEAQKPAIEAALQAWGSSFTSTVPIHVDASSTRQGYGGILASATPAKFFGGFKGAPDPDLWYPSAMANALAGKDLDPNNPEIIIHINSTMAAQFYLGTSGDCPTNLYDLESIILHEVGHGLGFLSNDTFDGFFGYGSIDQPTPYDAYAQVADGRRLMDLPSPSLELGKALTDALVWSGKNAIAANNGEKPKLYTPKPYQQGSSVSHLDEATFSSTGANSVMTPNLEAGEVFHVPGPLAEAMMADMMLKPPAGVPTGVPTMARNVKALVGDKSALVTFDPPTNARVSQVSSYKIKVNQTGAIVTGSTSPIIVTGLKNGTSYSFSVTATNVLGISPAATTNAIIPQAAWAGTVFDAVDAQHLTNGTFGGKQFIAYSDTKSGDLKFATLSGTTWSKSTIDGNASTLGKTKNNVSGYLSSCVAKSGSAEVLHLFYGDLTDKDLRHASFNGKKWSYEVVDGNGAAINDYKDSNRVRTSSDVSVSNGCAATKSGLQVFYRDESQGILLGASLVGGKWNYELVDGDRDTDGRTTGDVGFHLSTSTIGNTVYLSYDSVLQVNQDKKALKGVIRQAVRSTIYPEDWKYSNLQNTDTAVTVAGFDIVTSVLSNKVAAIWLAASGVSAPKADQVQWVTGTQAVNSQTPDAFGAPSSPVATNGTQLLFGCASRLCALNTSDQTISLVTSADISNSAQAAWVVVAGKKYALVSAGGKLMLYKSA
ncbi:MAG: hypothetical protein RL414_1056 [Actinomycetota bacterium]